MKEQHLLCLGYLGVALM